MKDQKERAKEFSKRWKERGFEKQEKQSFWEDLLENIYDISQPYNFIDPEKKVKVDNSHRLIDVYIPRTKVLIEHKSRRVSLDHKGDLGTAYEQARLYESELPLTEKPRWIITCNFEEFRIYDREHPLKDPVCFKLEELSDYIHQLGVIVNEDIKRISKEEKISIEASKSIAKIYQLLLNEYDNPTKEDLESLNIFCVRLVFCMFAEDSDIFKYASFSKIVHQNKRNPEKLREEIFKLFEYLNKPEKQRGKFPLKEYKNFPYVNGGLFEKISLTIPYFTQDIVDEINKACKINWADISPAIFGAAYEATVNPETRKSLGMHYTSINNIHKVIDPLFLDDLKYEFESIGRMDNAGGRRTKAYYKFWDKLSNLVFLDPACGSGNFLTETYEEIRRLENKIIKILYIDKNSTDSDGSQSIFIDKNFTAPDSTQSIFNVDLIRVSLDNFHGIEINDFACVVARTSLWITELKMKKETNKMINSNIDLLPLKSYDTIIEANALRVDWNEIVSSTHCDYIMGNPPYIGHQYRTKDQKEDMKIAFSDLSNHGKLDYVCAWFNKASDYIKNTKIEVAFVATNSIVQGESVSILWKHLVNKSVIINFAYKDFSWDNEAHVYCVIIGFSTFDFDKPKYLYYSDRKEVVDHINGYLYNAPDLFLKSRGKSQKNFPKMSRGSQPTDNGNLILNEIEKNDLLKKHPEIKDLIRPFMNGKDLINGNKKYCLWLVDIPPSRYLNIKEIRDRLKRISDERLKSPTKKVREQAETPFLFTQIRQPNNKYLAIPKTSSERRKYIPITFLDPNIIASDAIQIIQSDSHLLFGILISNVHNYWVNAVVGRLEMRYDYTPSLYNNFPFPKLNKTIKEKIEKTAKEILQARQNHPNWTLFDLYSNGMPEDLRKAHEANDKAVMEAYGFDYKMNEDEIVTELFKLYKKLT